MSVSPQSRRRRSTVTLVRSLEDSLAHWCNLGVRDRAFLVSTVISLLAIVAIAVLPKVFDDGPASWQIGAVGADAR